MSKRQKVALGGVCVLVAVLCTVPATAQGQGGERAASVPVAISTVEGTNLTVQPLEPVERAEVRVAGPEGYAAQKVVGKGQVEGPIALDLLADRRAPVGSRLLGGATPEPSSEVLADGLYRYEAVFMAGGERQVHTGRFFVEAGSAITREQKRAQLDGLRLDLETPRRAQRQERVSEGFAERNAIYDYDYLHLDDSASDGVTAITLDSDGIGVPDGYYWGLQNSNDRLDLGRTDTYGSLSDPDLTILYGGNVGVGTTAPMDYLEVAAPSGASSLSLRGLYGAYLRLITNISSWAIYDAGGGIPIVGVHGTNPSLLSLAPYQVSIDGDLAVSSSREIKTNFADVDSADVLKRIAKLPIQNWQLEGDPKRATHIGPVAEDFHAAFGLGRDDKHISPSDGVGVALVAIQELTKRVEALTEENRHLRGELAGLQRPAAPPPDAAGIGHRPLWGRR